VKIEVIPDEEYTRYAHRLNTKQAWHYRTKGSRIDNAFFLGIPKVLYDTKKKDPVNYGNASIMLRLYLLHAETGERYPVSLGIGTFGVNTPIDVSRTGGGFAVSLLLDVVELIRRLDVGLSRRFNAGLELTQFFPIQRQARLLLNVRVGYSP
jgi:hypothetical protein